MSDEQDIEGIEVDEVTVAGIVKDSEGHEWAIPAEELDDLSDMGTLNPFGKLRYDPNFHYQIIGVSEMSAKATEGFVPCTRREMGMVELTDVNQIEREYGATVSSHVGFSSGILVKKPRILVERQQKRKAAVATAVRKATEPTPEMLARVKRIGARNLKSASDLSETLDRGEAIVDSELRTSVSSKLTE